MTPENSNFHFFKSNHSPESMFHNYEMNRETKWVLINPMNIIDTIGLSPESIDKLEKSLFDTCADIDKKNIEINPKYKSFIGKNISLHKKKTEGLRNFMGNLLVNFLTFGDFGLPHAKSLSKNIRRDVKSHTVHCTLKFYHLIKQAGLIRIVRNRYKIGKKYGISRSYCITDKFIDLVFSTFSEEDNLKLTRFSKHTMIGTGSKDKAPKVKYPIKNTNITITKEKITGSRKTIKKKKKEVQKVQTGTYDNFDRDNEFLSVYNLFNKTQKYYVRIPLNIVEKFVSMDILPPDEFKLIRDVERFFSQKIFISVSSKEVTTGCIDKRPCVMTWEGMYFEAVKRGDSYINFFVKPNSLELYRAFKDEVYDENGRFYGCSIQSFSKIMRRRLWVTPVDRRGKIGKPERMVEVDFVSCNPTILHCLSQDINIPENIYVVSKDDNALLRSLFKSVGSIGSSSGTKDKFLKGVRSKIRSLIKENNISWEQWGYLLKNDSIEGVLELFIRHNEGLRPLLCKGIGSHAQHLDSEIALRVMSHCINEGVPVIGIHDSFLVPESKENMIITTMKISAAQAIEAERASIEEIAVSDIPLDDDRFKNSALKFFTHIIEGIRSGNIQNYSRPISPDLFGVSIDYPSLE